MIIRRTSFVKSSASIKECPDPAYPEYAFMGRSNVGKSSLINMLTNARNLAKTSSTPGKTRLINHFLINDSWYLTDLPGYGFAKVSKSMRARWEGLLQSYLLTRSNLVNSFLLVDIRHAPLDNDLAFIEWMGKHQIPFVIVFTKADKLSQQQMLSKLNHYKKILSQSWEPLPPYTVTSSISGAGRDDILAIIEQCNRDYNPG